MTEVFLLMLICHQSPHFFLPRMVRTELWKYSRDKGKMYYNYLNIEILLWLNKSTNINSASSETSIPSLPSNAQRLYAWTLCSIKKELVREIKKCPKLQSIESYINTAFQWKRLRKIM